MDKVFIYLKNFKYFNRTGNSKFAPKSWTAFKYLTLEEGQQLADDLFKNHGIKASG